MIWLILIPATLNLLAIAWLAAGWHFRRPAYGKRISVDGISVVVAARNEEHHLKGCLTALASQDVSVPFEVVVVLDRCNDASEEVVEGMMTAFRPGMLKVIKVGELPNGWTGKKHALTRGIEAANFQNLAFTDADCVVEKGWLQGMADAFGTGADLVLGAGPMRISKGLLNMLQRFETWMTAFLYMGMAGLGRPYMGVGRSIGYSKSLFRSASGFEAHKGRLSGDDDLLVNAVGRSAKVLLLNAKGTRSYSEAPSTWRSWFAQKLRHHSAAPAYKWPSKLILGAFHGLHAIFYLSLALALLCGEDPVRVLAIWMGRSVLAGILWASFPWPNRLDLLVLSPVLDLLYALYLFVVGPAGMLLRPRWKSN